jgi:hypothetical protein
MSIGIPNTFFKNSAAQAVASSIVPVNVTDLSLIAIAAAQTAVFNFKVPFSIGATGGFRFAITAPAAPTYVMAAFLVLRYTTPTVFGDNQTTLADFANASAVASECMLLCNFYIVNGTTAGTVSLQFAQENSDTPPITILRGASCSVVYV